MSSPTILCPILFLLAFSFAIGFEFDFDQQQSRSINILPRAHLRARAEARVAEINRSQRKWTAKVYPRFAEMTDAEFKMMLGLRENFTGQYEQNGKTAKAMDLESWRRSTMATNHRDILPTKFDARLAWPPCAQLIGYIQDQSTCGSCWAFSSASVIQDRICIASGGRQKVPISAQDILSCTSEMIGCAGGIPEWAFHYWSSQGVCTGFGYMPSPMREFGCKPYAYPPSKTQMFTSTPRCERDCQNSAYPIRYNQDRHYGKADKVVNLVNAKPVDIQRAIMQGGPVVASMIVFTDLQHYSEGIYELDPKAQQVGGHAVRIIGWGEENGTPYWLAANSWSAEWGMNGTFKIVRGKNECGIEARGITFGTPDL